MKVLRFRTHWTMDLVDEPEPVAGPGEVILEVDAVGICGSDIHGFAGITDRRKPGVVMGHEIGGRIAGSDETVTVFPQLGCQTCPQCLHGLEQLCDNLRIIGVDPTRMGGFAERLPVPAANVVRMPGASAVTAALVEPYAVALNAISRTPWPASASSSSAPAPSVSSRPSPRHGRAPASSTPTTSLPIASPWPASWAPRCPNRPTT